jgi:hypothetical protein
MDMLRHASGWTKLSLVMIPLFCAPGCMSVANETAICDGSAAARTAHAAALAQDGGVMSITTGAHLIKVLDAGCDDQ